jgi:hypothetical protein
MKITVKYFFLADVLFFGGLAKIWINTYYLGESFISGAVLE